jgi:transcriptional regulator with XRE-family HTH domain
MSRTAGRPTIKSRQVASELRRYRIAAGMNTVEVGKLLGVSQSQISRVELGQRGLAPDEVAAMLGLYRVPAAHREELMRLVRQAAEPGLWQNRLTVRLPNQWQTLIDYESRATKIFSYESVVIPGILQTADYARAMIEGTAETRLPAEEVDAKVSARLGRQAIMSRTDPPILHALLFEPALLVPAGGQAVMRRQLRSLVEHAERPTTTIQVVPLPAGPHPGLDGAFVIMDLPDEPSVVYQESKTRNAFLEQDDLGPYRLAWERILGAALSVDESMSWMASAAEGFEEVRE